MPTSSNPPTIIANWKMNFGQAETVKRIGVLRTKMKGLDPQVKAVICPAFTSLPAAAKALGTSRVHLGAQDVFWDEQGAYTGEISPLMLSELGVEYVIVGHSERRHILGETDVMVARKMISALAHGMMPILCVGETGDQRRQKRHERVVADQLQNALRSLPPPPRHRRLYIAYEPIWAVGTGQAADPAEALAMRALIEQTLIDLYSESLAASSFRILYGGSVDASNVTTYVYPGGFDGALVGTASLEPTSFVTMLKAVKTVFAKKPGTTTSKSF
jgi:triosephosphate isomerase